MKCNKDEDKYSGDGCLTMLFLIPLHYILKIVKMVNFKFYIFYFSLSLFLALLPLRFFLLLTYATFIRPAQRVDKQIPPIEEKLQQYHNAKGCEFRKAGLIENHYCKALPW
jgi:hypothetical protein